MKEILQRVMFTMKFLQDKYKACKHHESYGLRMQKPVTRNAIFQYMYACIRVSSNQVELE